MTATNTFGATGLLARNSGGSSVLYAFDEAGNTVERLTTSGTVLISVYTDAFGATTGAASGDPYSGFGTQWGYYTDAETGLTLCGHRFYDSTVGRWINRDAAGYGGGVNLYRAYGNGPLAHADPNGLQAEGDDEPDENGSEPSGGSLEEGLVDGMFEIGAAARRAANSLAEDLQADRNTIDNEIREAEGSDLPNLGPVHVVGPKWEGLLHLRPSPDGTGPHVIDDGEPSGDPDLEFAHSPELLHKG